MQSNSLYELIKKKVLMNAFFNSQFSYCPLTIKLLIVGGGGSNKEEGLAYSLHIRFERDGKELFVNCQ